MVFNGEANNLDICTLADERIGTNDVSFPLARKALFANQILSTIWKKIWKSYGGWTFQDSNDSGDPFADINSVSGTSKIAIPTAATDLIGVSWLNGTEYKPLRPITIQEIQAKGYTIQNYKNTASSTPEEYLPIGNSIYIFPALNSTTTAAFRAFFDRGSTYFTPTSTTATPGFMPELHPALSCGMAMLEAQRATLTLATPLRIEFEGWLINIGDFYSNRFTENAPATIKRGSDYVNELV